MDIIEKRIDQRNTVIEKAKEFVNSLPISVSAFLIGSYSRGDFNLWSDVDIVLISHFEGNFLGRLKSINMPPGFEVIPLNPEELKKMLSKNNPITLEIRKNGVILRDDLNVSDMFFDR